MVPRAVSVFLYKVRSHSSHCYPAAESWFSCSHSHCRPEALLYLAVSSSPAPLWTTSTEGMPPKRSEAVSIQETTAAGAARHRCEHLSAGPSSLSVLTDLDSSRSSSLFTLPNWVRVRRLHVLLTFLHCNLIPLIFPYKN